MTQAHHEREPRLKPLTTRQMLELIVSDLGTVKTLVNGIYRKEQEQMALSQKLLDAFATLIADIDEKFRAANAPLIAELTSQRDAALAEDVVDQNEVDRLTALVDTAEADTLAAIQAAQEHVDALT